MEDPRSTVGQMARGSNTYMGGSKSPWAGKFTDASVNRMTSASMLPEYKKPTLQEVARSFFNGGVQ